MMSTLQIGILGGSFDPVHTGHLLMAQDAAEHFELDRVLFIPCAIPPHKDGRQLAPAKHRLAMLAAALAGNPVFKLDAREIRRTGTSFTIDTIRELTHENAAARYYFIIGDDSLIDLPNWRQVEALLESCEFITLARPGVTLAPETPALPPDRRKRLLANRRVGHRLEISSSEIRLRIAEARSIRYLVPDAVADYIALHGLYQPVKSGPPPDIQP